MASPLLRLGTPASGDDNGKLATDPCEVTGRLLTEHCNFKAEPTPHNLRQTPQRRQRAAEIAAAAAVTPTPGSRGMSRRQLFPSRVVRENEWILSTLSRQREDRVQKNKTRREEKESQAAARKRLAALEREREQLRRDLESSEEEGGEESEEEGVEDEDNWTVISSLE